MGLDMYACVTKEKPERSVDFKASDDGQLHYWRKHPNLHGWMERLYREKGGCEDCFNCVNVQLDRADLDRLEADIRGGGLPETTGFFFGRSDGSEAADDLLFVANAREALAASLTVFYTSWW